MRRLWAELGKLIYWLGWPGLWLVIRGSQRTRLILTLPDGRVLFVKGWLGTGEWSLPGGGLHRSEDPLKGALRELREETGLQLTTNQLKFVDTVPVNDHGHHFKALVFAARLEEKPEIRPRKLEIIDIGWHQPEKVNKLSPSSRQVLEQ